MRDRITGDDNAVADDPTETPAAAPTPSGSLVPVGADFGVTDFDPQGDGGENSGRVGALVDGDPSTLWVTEGYSTRRLGGLKEGVGLLIVLEPGQTFDQLILRSPTVGWTAELRVSDVPAEAIRSLVDFGGPVSTLTDIDARVDPLRVDLDGLQGSALLVWITDLGPNVDDDGRSRVRIGELAVM